MENVNTKLPDDPLKGSSIQEIGKKLRDGSISCLNLTKIYYKRINILNSYLHAYIHLDESLALSWAEGIDKLFKSGVDLGPLMGIPVAVKDICSVESMPTTNGSQIISDDITGPEGSLVKRLKSLGCVILGKTHTVEFALGATGLNKYKGTPWNPWDSKTHRMPGGSSSGSAVAVASGLAAFAIGTDTGGSVRIPAALNGIIGLKTTKNRWPTDGIFPLSPTLDTPGPITRSVKDTKLIFNTYNNVNNHNKSLDIKNLSFGKLKEPFTLDLDPEVKEAYENICHQLVMKGAKIEDVVIPEANEKVTLFPKIVGSEIISAFGIDRFKKNVDKMDPVTGNRAKLGLDVSSYDYITAKKRIAELEYIVNQYFSKYDALLSPTTVMQPLDVKKAEIGNELHERSLLASANTQPVNIFGICGITYPIQKFAKTNINNFLPVGLQIICNKNDDEKALEIALALEKQFGEPELPDINKFL
jgi:aspartyl-tRNA(Asn)/glutamyl-tRNA(Gln) amidotransferase subunit A